MYKQKHYLNTLLLLLFVFSKSFSQVTAVPATGCAPLSVTFSGPAGASAVSWTLGSGLGTSTLTSPNPLYTTPGTYNITYTAIVNGSPVSYNTQLVVSQGPFANFSYVIPSSHCAPMTVNFTAGGGSPGYIYTWAFGDLSPLGNGTSVSHTYNFSNNFIPFVTVLDPVTTCTALATNNTGTIHVSSPPSTVIVSSNGLIGCSAPFTTNISGSGSTSGSPMGGGLTFNWNFAGGSPSSSGLANPGQVSFGMGSSVISLVVTDNNQCSNSGTVGVSVFTPSLSATIPGTVCLNGPVPATIQTTQGYVYFDIQGLGLSGFFTNANSTTVIDTVCILTAPGIHTIDISVSSLGCPPVIIQKTVFVEQVSPNFTLTPPNFSCASPMIASYLNLSASNTGASLTFTWLATWPPNSSHNVVPTTTAVSNMGNATFTFYQGSANPYTIYQYFIPNITLIAQSSSIAHCSAGIVKGIYDTLVRPTAYFNLDKRQGCAPLTIKLRDTSFTAPSNPIVSYTWCNGAPTSSCVSGTLLPPPASNSVILPQVFTYTNPGTYYPYLTITTALGCTDISFYDTVTVVNPPTINASIQASACAGAPVTINLTGTGTNVPSSAGIEHWHVTTDQGFFSGCITNKNPSFPFTHVGTHTLLLMAYQANCGSTVAAVPSIQVKGPMGKFQYETTCTGNRKSVNFNIHLQQAATATMDFGDGSSEPLNVSPVPSTATVVNHIYANTGDYVVTLASTNPVTGCAYTFTQTVKVRDPKANITFAGQPIPALPNALACVNTMYKFTAATSVDAKIGCGRGYVWTFQAPGSPGYTLHPLDRPVPSFSTTFIFVPNVPPSLDTNYVVVDKISLDTFRVAGIYTITLMIKDENSCVDTEVKIFRISDAAPVFTFAANPVCKSSQPIQIINTTPASQVSPDFITNYNWEFGDGSTSTSTNPIDNPTHTYINVFPPSQVFTIVCSATNAPLGCMGKTTHTIQINNPVAGFYGDNMYPCVPLGQPGHVNFFANVGYSTYSVNYGNSSSAWSTFNNNFNGAGFNYFIPGAYTPTLTVIDAAGCKSSESLTVHATGQPTAVIKFENDKTDFCHFADPKIYSEPKINVTPLSDNIWTVLNVTLPPPGIDTITPFFPPGIHLVSLTVYADQHCPSTATAQVKVYDPKATAFAVAEKTTICLGDPLIVSVKDFHDLASWKWFFGDNVSQPLIYASAPNGTNNPVVYYLYNTFPTSGNNGFTTVNLLYYPPGNACEEVSSFSIHVIKVNADFRNENDLYSHCLNISDSFTNTTLNPTSQNFEPAWSFGDGTPTLTLVNPAVHTYTQAGVFPVKLVVTDADYGCTGTSVKNITVFPLPKATIAITPTLNCSNGSFTVSGAGTPGISGTLTGTLSSAAGSQTIDLAPSNTFTIPATSTISTTYILKVKDNNSCESGPASMSVSVVPPTPEIIWDTTIVIGQLATINAYVGPNYSYTWYPVVTNLNCDTCLTPNVVSNTTVNITYTVLVQDELLCSVVKNIYRVHVDPKVSLDVPTAFTPNGDGINDIIYPNGWGLRKLNYFKVFNRWGQLVFESNDLKIGWDGLFNGVPQNMETYVYQVSAETYLDKQPTVSKSGTFKLIR